MSESLTGKQLKKRWKIQPFQLFQFVTQLCLPAYDISGRMIRRRTEDEIYDEIEAAWLDKRETDISGATLYVGAIEKGILTRIWKQSAKEIYAQEESQLRCEYKEPPPDSVPMNFILSDDQKKAKKQIKFISSCLFKMKDIIRFEKKHGLAQPEDVVEVKRKIRPNQELPSEVCDLIGNIHKSGEVELIYNEIQEGEKYGLNEKSQRDEFRQGIAIRYYESQKDKFKIVEKVDLKNTKNFDVTLIDQVPRTIKGKIIQNIVKRKGYGKLNYQNLYIEYLKYD